MAQRQEQSDPSQAKQPQRLEEGVGASDGYSGAAPGSDAQGNASGSPDAEQAMRPGGLPPEGDVKADRARLFPEEQQADRQQGDPQPGAGEPSPHAQAQRAPLKRHGDKDAEILQEDTTRTDDAR